MEFVSSLGENPYFGAGTGLFGIAALLALGRKGSSLANTVFRRRFLISLELNNLDRSYDWVLRWIEKRSGRWARHISVNTDFTQTESGLVNTTFTFHPSPGVHLLIHGRKLIRVERNREKSMHLGKEPYETVTLTTLGTDPSFFRSILAEAKDQALGELEFGTIIYQAFGHEWRPFGYPRRKRPLKSVVLGEGVSEFLVNDVRDFIANEKWYTDRGIPYRRGYLLHGPPGCGKSSFITSLASELNYSICILSLSERTLTDDRLQHLLNVAPLKSLLLLEDVDAAFSARDQPESPEHQRMYEGLTRVTFSGLLNAIDGVASAEARLLFMTTNFPETLDSALVRPGRVDVKQKIDLCTDYQLARMFRQYYYDMDLRNIAENLVERFVDGALKGSRPPSAAQVQGFLLNFKADPENAAKNSNLMHEDSLRSR